MTPDQIIERALLDAKEAALALSGNERGAEKMRRALEALEAMRTTENAQADIAALRTKNLTLRDRISRLDRGKQHIKRNYENVVDQLLAQLTAESAGYQKAESEKATLRAEAERWKKAHDGILAGAERMVREARVDLEAENAALRENNLTLRRRIHLVEQHNQFFERCESGWCNPSSKSDPVCEGVGKAWKTPAEYEVRLSALREKVERLENFQKSAARIFALIQESPSGSTGHVAIRGVVPEADYYKLAMDALSQYPGERRLPETAVVPAASAEGAPETGNAAEAAATLGQSIKGGDANCSSHLLDSPISNRPPGMNETRGNQECCDPQAAVLACVVCGTPVHTCELRQPNSQGSYCCPAHPDGAQLTDRTWVCSEECWNKRVRDLTGQDWRQTAGGDSQLSPLLKEKD